MTTRSLIQGIVIAVIATGMVVYFWPNDFNKVERRTKSFLEAASKSGPENIALASARVLNAASFIATNAVITTGYPSDRGVSKSEIVTMMQQARIRLDKIVITSRGRSLTRLSDHHIQVDMTIEAEIDYQGSREEHIGTYRFLWEKSENDWMIKQVEPREIIRHPSGSFYPSY